MPTPEAVHRKITKAETIIRSAPPRDAASRAALAAVLEVLKEIALALDHLENPQFVRVV